MILTETYSFPRYVSKNYALDGYIDGDYIVLSNGLTYTFITIITNPCKVLLFDSVHCPALDAKLIALMPELNSKIGKQLDISPILGEVDKIFDRLENGFLPTAAEYFA